MHSLQNRKRLNFRIVQQSTDGFSSIYLILLVIVLGSIFLTGTLWPELTGLNYSDGVTNVDTGTATQSAHTFYTLKDLGGNGSGSTGNGNGNSTSGTGNSNAQKSLQLKTLEFQKCEGGTASVDMELDTSGSMAGSTSNSYVLGGPNSKLNDLKKAVNFFLDNLSDDSLIGIQSFDSSNPRNVVTPISTYKDVKGTLQAKVNALRTGLQTPTYTALQFSYSILKQAQADYPDKNFVFIFVSDGIPHPPGNDPRNFNPNPADQIKSLGITIFTIGIGNDSGLTGLMSSIASSPDKAYFAPDSGQLEDIYRQIGSQICGS